MFIPYSNYPKDHVFDLYAGFPELFKGIDFADFFATLEPNRVRDFTDSGLFIQSSRYQDNLMTGLIMLLSAIERTISLDHKPLDGHLASTKFKEKMKLAKDGEDAFNILQTEMANHLSSYGSIKAVVGFFCDNLSNEQKLQLIMGINLAHKYKKSTPPKGSSFVALYTPVYDPAPVIDVANTVSVDEALSKRIKAVVYDIRNGFVHQAKWIPFGSADYIKKNAMYTHEKYENGAPKEAWNITMTFEQLHTVATTAYQEFWRKEYHQSKQEK